MIEPTATTKERILGAIFGGCIAAVAISFAMFPLMYLVFDNFFELHFGAAPAGAWMNTMIIVVSCLAWLFISMYAGGYVGARIARQNEFHIAWTIIGIAFLIFLAYARTEVLPRFVEIAIIVPVGILGALAGCHSGIKYKERKNKDQRRQARNELLE